MPKEDLATSQGPAFAQVDPHLSLTTAKSVLHVVAKAKILAPRQMPFNLLLFMQDCPLLMLASYPSGSVKG
jgi:hypothetical protein